MELFLQGDAQAFDALFGRYARPLHGYLARLVGPSAAEDLTQVTFMSLVRARGRFQSGARVKPWVYAIATNAARDFQRRLRPEDLTPEGELPAVAAENTGPRDLGLEQSVHAALLQLPAAQREAIILHRFEGLSFAEIAQTLDVTESAVKVRAHRGYEKLRSLLKGLKEESTS
jgi:RNA polymerase sigma-70 factor (ECF subfamily)